MIVDTISDLHGFYPNLEGGDLLIVAGDLTARDNEKGWLDFEIWILNQNYKEKIIIAGNHDNFLQSIDKHRMWKYWEKVGITYLCDSGTGFEGLKIWGSPRSLTFPGINPHCTAFTGTEKELAEKWALIPKGVDILITHSPPYDYLDHIKTEYNDRFPAGSVSLYEKIIDIYPKLHVFGHIHEGYGKEIRDFYPVYGHETVTFINCSHVNERYQPVNKPIRVIL